MIMRRRLALAVLVLAVVAAAVWVVRRDRTPPHYTGFVEGEERVIRSEVTGRVLAVIFAEGAQVPPNAVLARLDPADIQTRLVAKHEELDVAEADIRRQQQQVELSESTWKQDVSARQAELRQAASVLDLAERSLKREEALVATGARAATRRAARSIAPGTCSGAPRRRRGRSPSPAASSTCSSSAASWRGPRSPSSR